MGFGAEYFKGQKYDYIKKDLVKSDQLFTDPEFPPTQKSLFFSKTDEDIVWRRPTELCRVPKLMIDGATCEDLIEGELGNRWFIVACSSLANYKQLFNKVVPEVTVQEYSTQTTHRGIFRFVFWLSGRWTEVVIDDLLPTKHGKLVHCHSKTKNEFWSALLEKAYAKLYGDYESLSNGVCVDALVDFTGGVADRHDISEVTLENSGNLLLYKNMIQNAAENSAIITACIKDQAEEPVENSEEYPTKSEVHDESGADVLVLESEANVSDTPPPGSNKNSPPSTQQHHASMDTSGSKQPKTGYFRASSVQRDGWLTDSGLLKGHGYNVREVRKVTIDKKEKVMVRLQSPWGTGEWTGAWSNLSDEMRRLSVQEKNKIGLKFEAESEFWMTMDDFIYNFTDVELCRFFNTSLFSLKKKWNETLIVGNWVLAGTDMENRAGGNSDHPSFLSNPQYMIDIPSEDGCELIISLSQNDRTLERRNNRTTTNLNIGFTVMKVEENRKYRLHRPGDILLKTSFSSQDRSIFKSQHIPRGRYVIVPTTKEPRETGEFLLRVYNGCNYETKLLVKDEPKKPSLICMSSPHTVVQLNIISAQGFTSEKDGVKLNPLCVVKCEGETLKTNVVRDSTTPKWNSKFILFKKEKAEKGPITIQLMNSHKLSNESMGEATLREFSDENGETKELSLFQKAKKKDQSDIELPGKLNIKVFSSDNLSEF